MCEFYGVETLDGFGAFSRAEIAAAALALAYVKRTQLEAGRRSRRRPGGRAARAWRSTPPPAPISNSHARSPARAEGSLLATIDLTATPAGARLLAERLASPLTDPAAIEARLDRSAFWSRRRRRATRYEAKLKGAPDFLRSLSRLSLSTAAARATSPPFRDGLAAASALARILEGALAPPAELRRATSRALAGRLRRAPAPDLIGALADDLPLVKRDGGFVPRRQPCRSSTRRAALRDESRRAIAEMQAGYAEETGVRQLRIKHNNFLG